MIKMSFTLLNTIYTKQNCYCVW